MKTRNSLNGFWPLSVCRRAPCLLSAILLPAFLVGCEAQLNLSGLEAGSSQSIQRTDFYQALASTPRVTLLAGNNGVLLTSLDQGKNWSRQIIANGRSLIDLDASPMEAS